MSQVTASSAPIVKPRFWSIQLDLKRIAKVVLHLLVALLVPYLLGFCVSIGPSMDHLGWFYRTDWGRLPESEGQIIRFAEPGHPAWRKYVGSSVKRVTAITPEGYEVAGDNSEQSKDSRDWDKPIPKDHVSGVVVWAWSPKPRTLRELELTITPKRILISNDSKLAAVCIDDRSAGKGAGIYDLESGMYLRTVRDVMIYKWEDNQRLIIGSYDADGLARYAQLDALTGKIVQLPTTGGPAKDFSPREITIRGKKVRLLWEGKASPLEDAFFGGVKINGHLGMVVPEIRNEKYSLTSRIKSKTRSNPANNEIFVEIDNGDTDRSYAQLWYFGYMADSLDGGGNCSSITTRPPLKANGEVHIKLFKVANEEIPQMRKLLNINDLLYTPQLTTLAEVPGTS